jgi:hypothetical protein
MPFYNFVLDVDGDKNRYYFDKTNKKILKTEDVNRGEVKKIKDGEYEIIFHNIFLPFNDKEHTININFKTIIPFNKESVVFVLPEQKIYYETLNSEKSQKFNVKSFVI